MTTEERLERIERMLAELLEARTIKDWYSTAEFAELAGKSEYTCREWARLGRINAVKKFGGHGVSKEWVISNEEYLRYRKEGLLPLRVSINSAEIGKPS